MLKAQNEAAPPPADAQGGRGGRGGRQFDPAQMQERMLGRIQEWLGASAEEWNAIKPLVQDVFTAQRKSMSGMRGMFGGRGGRGGPGGPGGPGAMMNESNPETDALSTAVESETVSNADLKVKLTAYRESQKKNQEELKAAREKLRKVLSLRQEAKLVLMGILD